MQANNILKIAIALFIAVAIFLILRSRKMGYKLKYFTLSEFDSDDAPGSGKNMQASFLKMLDKARGFANVPFRINSGFRTAAKNKAVGGALKSAHMTGQAADIAVSGSDDLKLKLKALYKAGFRRFGVANSFIHADNDSTKNNAVWGYPSTSWTLEKISKL